MRRPRRKGEAGQGWKILVLLGRIELPASPLPRECSTTELQQRQGAALWQRWEHCQAACEVRVALAKADNEKGSTGW
jgi:hypothetical protein